MLPPERRKARSMRFGGILGHLAANHSSCMLSLELFNHVYWKQDALAVATTGLRKTRAAVRKALKL